jgi:hypothetical protein
MTRTALELIGQTGLGYSFDPLTEDGVHHPYSTTAKLFSYVYFPGIMGPSSDFADNHTRTTLFKMAFSRTYFLSISLKIGTPKFRRFVLNLLPWKNLHEMRDIIDVLTKTSVEIYEEKKKALEKGDKTVTQQIDEGNDIMSILSAYHLFP